MKSLVLCAALVWFPLLSGCTVLAIADAAGSAVVYGVKLEGVDGRAGMAAVAVKPGVELDLKALAQHVTSQLPGYAVPQYVRLLQSVETTGTFKYQKVQLKKEGIDQNLVNDPLYSFNAATRSYTALV